MIKHNDKRLRSIFETLLKSNGVSRNESETVETVLALLSTLPLEIVTSSSEGKVKPNLYLKLPKRGDISSPPIMLSAHMDTVEATPNIQFEIIDGVYKTDGNTILGSDDKAGVAAIIESLYSIHESGKPHPTIEVAFTVEEEIGLEGAKAFDKRLIESKRGIVVDADGEPGVVMYAGPSQVLYNVKIKGKASHAGMSPEEGRSAILFASRCISKIPFGRIDSETTTNIGTINGGKATNIVAENCTVTGEIRSHDPIKLELILNQTKDIFEKESKDGFSVLFESRYAYKSFKLDTNSKFMNTVKNVMNSLSLPIEYKVCGGGCDANIFNDELENMECINLACGMTDVHTHSESIRFSDIQAITDVLINTCLS